ncbi:hypothetical protein ENBRE01_1835 [Enteropsectra breve]|nr:hypothetical protein ENBRE01_1835 [Enteropsectra breve]
MARKSYTVKEKLLAIRRLSEEHGNISKVSRELRITNKMRREWRNSEEKHLSSNSKHTTRSIGSGRTTLYRDVKAKLLSWVHEERSTQKRIVTFDILCKEALHFAEEFNITFFEASNNWIVLFMKRDCLSSRKITSVGQEDHRPLSLIKATVMDYFETLSHQLTNVDQSNSIMNMDKTPVYVDMMSTKTVSFKGEKNTEAHGTGDNKTHLTVVLSITAQAKY